MAIQQKKKILVLSHSPNIGGAELALNGLIKDTKDVYEWHVVFASAKQAAHELIQYAHKVSYVELPWWCHESHDHAAKVHKNKLLKELHKLELLASSSDILLTNTITIPWLGLVSQKLNKPHIWYIHEFGNLDHKLEFINGYSKSLKVISDVSSRILTISNAVKNHLSNEIDANKIDLIHQAIDIEKISFQPPKGSTNKLLCLGAIKPSKGQQIAIEAMKHLPEFTLDIIGPIADTDYYNQLVKISSHHTNITVQGRNFVANTELSTHDTLLMCSDNEALGRVTLEGLAAGKVVVGFGSISTKEILSDGRGYIYYPNTPSQLVSCIRSADTKSLNFTANRKYVEQKYGTVSQKKDFKSCIDKSNTEHQAKPDHLSNYLLSLESKGLFFSRKSHLINTVKRATLPLIPSKIKKGLKKFLIK